MTRKFRIWYKQNGEYGYHDVKASKIKEAYKIFQKAFPKAEMTHAKIIG